MLANCVCFCQLLFKCTLDRDKPHVFEPHMEKINLLFSGETLEQILANLRSDGSDWSKKQLEILNKMVSNVLVIIFTTTPATTVNEQSKPCKGIQ